MIGYSVGDAGGLESDGMGRGSCSSGQCWGCALCPVLVLLELGGCAWEKGARRPTQLLLFSAPQHSELRSFSQPLQLIFLALLSDHTLLLTLKEYLTPII